MQALNEIFVFMKGSQGKRRHVDFAKRDPAKKVRVMFARSIKRDRNSLVSHFLEILQELRAMFFVCHG